MSSEVIDSYVEGNSVQPGSEPKYFRVVLRVLPLGSNDSEPRFRDQIINLHSHTPEDPGQQAVVTLIKDLECVVAAIVVPQDQFLVGQVLQRIRWSRHCQNLVSMDLTI